MIGDRHIHSHFSFDSNQPITAIIERAVRLHMTEICFTDHCDMDLGPDWILNLKGYSKTMEWFKNEYKDKIDIHIGVEMGLNPKYNWQIDDFLSSYPFEFVIGSVHTMLGDDPYYRNNYKMDDKEFYRIYFETALERLKNSRGFDTFGHFDYVVRYGEKKDQSYDPLEYADLIDEILKELVSRKIALELNTAGIRKGVGFVHPHSYILKRYKELGGRLISVGSDAHEAEAVGADFDEALKLMNQFGFDENDIIGYRNV